MRVRLASLLTFMTMLGAAGVARGQDDAFQSAARQTQISAYGPVAVLFVSGAFGNPADSYSIYAYWDPPSPADAPGRHRAYAVRKASRTSAEVVWADSHACDALVPALESLEALQPPRIDIWGIGEDGGLGLVMDGIGYDLWVRWPAWPEATGYDLRMSGNVNTPLAEWTNAFAAGLEPCWTTKAPLSG